MDVLHIITRYLKRGGAEQDTKYTIQALREEGINTSLLVGKDSDIEALEEENVSVTQIESLDNDLNPIKDLRAVLEVTEILRKSRPDIVHTHQGKASIVGRAAAILADVPCVIYGLYGDHVDHPKLNLITGTVYRCVEQFLGRHTDYFVSVGKEIQHEYKRRGIGTPDQHKIIHSGLELSSFQEASFQSEEDRNQKRKQLGIENPDAFVVGKVASLEPRKGYDDAIRVAEQVCRRLDSDDVRFLFVGSGPLREELENQVKDAGLWENIIFTGFREDIADVMACFDVFMLVSHMEGLPQVLVQASATGLPIVSFDVEGANEIIRNGRNGYVIQNRNVDALTERLIEFFDDPDRQQKFGAESEKRVDGRWTIEERKRKVKELYQNVISDLSR